MSPLSADDLKHEQRKILPRAGLAILICALVMGASYWTLPTRYAFPTSLSERLAFALQADLFVILWLAIGVQMVSRGRYFSRADNKGSAFAPPSPAIAIDAAFLQNTLEQVVMAVGAHLVFASLAGGPTLALIPAAVALFAAGRIAFRLGYAHGAGGRALGIVMTVIPTVALLAYSLVLVAGRLLGHS